MRILLIIFAFMGASSMSTAHEIKELEVIKIWQDQTFKSELYWMIADTVVTENTKFIDCAGFDENGVPLFQTIVRTTAFATQGGNANTGGGFNNADVVEVRCAYSR